MKATFKAGKYYIGDPCYVFDKSWNSVLDQTNFFELDEQFINGVQVCGGGTAYGDGTYLDNLGRSYSVDAGLIAILPIELLEIDKVDMNYILNCGEIIEFENDFEVEIENGIFQFDNIIIDTARDSYEDYEYEDEDYE